MTATAASKFAQLIGDTLTHHLEASGHIGPMMADRVKKQFLDDLEEHTTKIVGPVIDLMLEHGDMPDEVRKLLEQAKTPSAAFGSFVQQFLVYGVMFSLASTGLQPLTQELANTLWSAFPTRPISPPDLATAVVRGIGSGDSAGVDVPGWATDEAKKSGISPNDFYTMVGTTGLAPSLQLLFEMIRRQFITEDQLVEGIKESDVKDKWIPYVAKLRYVLPTPTDFVAAAIREQLPQDVARALATLVGLSPDTLPGTNDTPFDVMRNISGRPPGPVEMGHAANRGFMPWTGTGPSVLSFEQGIAESDIKTKWTPLLQKLAEYFPPNGEIGQLLLHGGLTGDQAEALWKANGVPPDLAKAYRHVAEIQQITQDRALAKGEIETLVVERAITDAEAEGFLEKIGYTGTNAKFIIGMAHFRYQLTTIRNVIRRVSTLYTSHKITTAQATEALKADGIPQAQVDAIIHELTILRDANTQHPTAAQIESGFHYQIIDQPTAIALLKALGYDEWSAWFVLSAREHAPLPDEPPIPASYVA